MKFPFNVYLCAFAVALLTTGLAVPWWRRWSYRVGHVDDPGHRKIHETPIALAGGLAVMTGLIVPLTAGLGALALFGQFNLFSARPEFSVFGTETVELLSYGVNRRAWQLAVIVLGALAMVSLGYLDDKHELGAGAKFGGQLIIAAAVAASGIRITLFVESLAFSYVVTILWILTVTNAFNFMDNMNGLCAGLGAIASWQFAVSAASHGQYLVAVLSLLICGALVGFLPYNFPRATVFLGDAGSHLVGFLLSILAILPHFYTPEHGRTWAVLTPLLVLAVPLADLVWVVALRWRAGRPVYVGDTNHLSHRLVQRGFNRTTAVALIWLLASSVGALSFLLQ